MSTRDLVDDRRGAILVVGVFMAAVLAGALFMIIGTGDAILYRERLQDGADAIAYSSAGVHARGMNLIVLVNLVMAALLAILIALRMLIAVLGVAIAVCGVVSVLSAGTLTAICAPVLASAPAMVSSLEKAANAYEKFLAKTLPTLSKVERVIALTTPYVALRESVKVSGEYAPLVTRGLAASPSMVPFLPDGKRLGLPVKEMEPDAFCKKSAELGVSHAFFWAPGWLESAATKLAGALVSSFTGYFCSGQSLGSSQAVHDSVDELCKDEEKACVAGKNGAQFCKTLADGTREFDDARCKKETQKQVKKGLGQSKPSSGASLAKATPKVIWDNAKHGGVWFQVWGFALGDEAWPRRMDRGVAIASSVGMPVPDTRWGNLRVAQAEFYFDGSGDWSTLSERCMWELGWRARLRRVDLHAPELSGTLPSKLVHALGKPLGSAFDDVLVQGGLVERVFDPASWQLAASNVTALQSGAPHWELVH
jgi:hypothetical protein